MWLKTLIASFVCSMGCAAAWAQTDDLPASAGYALDSMAPEGHWATKVELRSNSYDKWYDDSGKEQNFRAAFNGLNLNGAVFPPLALLGAGATLGTSSLYAKANTQIAQIILGYGLRDDLTLGFIFPFVKTQSQVDFNVSGGNTGFSTAFNPNLPIGPTNFPFAPVGAGAVAPLGTAGVKQLLSNPAFGYGYAPIGNSQSSGLSDSTAGLLWRFHKDEKSSAILGAGVRFGIAKAANPDNLSEVPIGDGSHYFRLRMEYFRDLGKDFDAHLLGESFTSVADRADMRVPQNGQLLATANSRESLQRKMGNFQEYDAELGHRWGAWRVAVTQHLYIKGKDSYTSDKGTNTSALEANTNVRADQYRVSLGWSGIDAWRQAKIPLPLIIKLEMQDTYGGRNFPKVRDYYLQLTSFF